MVDKLVIAVARTASEVKQGGVFSSDDRVDLLKEVFRDEPRVECLSFEGLLVDFADSIGARVVIRGFRALADFEYEFQMAQMNRELAPTIETVFFAPDVRYSFLSASLVREVASLGGDVSGFVSAPVLAALSARLGR